MPPDIVTLTLVFVLSAAVGSFLNVCIYRLPLGLSIVSPPSSCPVCNARLRARDNVPIIGYLLLRGRCAHCGARISPRYPLVEALTAVVAVGLFFKYSITPEFFVYFIFSSALVVITFIDLDHRIIPDVISLPGIAVGLAASFVLPEPGWAGSGIGILLGGGALLAVAVLYSLITGKEGMGGGDIKLLAMIGAFLGWQAVVFVIFASSIVGSIVGLVLLRAYGKSAKSAIPFGPFLALGALAYIFAGRELISLYLGLVWARA